MALTPTYSSFFSLGDDVPQTEFRLWMAAVEAALEAGIDPADIVSAINSELGSTDWQDYPSDADIATAYANEVPAASTVEAEAGTETELRTWSPERIAEAIAALAPSGGGGGGGGSNSTNDFRLTLESGVPVSAAEQTAKTTVYLTPYTGSGIALYDGADWAVLTSAEVSLSLTGLTADTNYDIFAYDVSGTLTLEAVAWSTSGAGTSTRATAIAYQDGVAVKSGTPARRYVGTIRTTATTGQCEDSFTKRFVWNVSNRVPRKLKRGTATGTYAQTSGTWLPWLNDSSHRVDFVIGLAISLIRLDFVGLHSVSGGGTAYIGLDLNAATTGNDADFVYASNSTASVLTTASATFSASGLTGYNFLTLMQQKGASSTTFYGILGDIKNGAAGFIDG